MNIKNLLCASIGGFIGAIIMTVILFSTSTGAFKQAEPSTNKQRDVFGKITCTGLTILNPYNDNSTSFRLDHDDYGGLLEMRSIDSDLLVKMGSDRHGPFISLFPHDTREVGIGINISHDEYGGAIDVFGKDYALSRMAHNQYGGYTAVSSKKGSFVAQATMSVNNNGTGIFRTWDKDGRPQQ